MLQHPPRQALPAAPTHESPPPRCRNAALSASAPGPPVLQEQAEQYCESLRLNGLISTIEPAGGGSGSDGTSSS